MNLHIYHTLYTNINLRVNHTSKGKTIRTLEENIVDYLHLGLGRLLSTIKVKHDKLDLFKRKIIK